MVKNKQPHFTVTYVNKINNKKNIILCNLNIITVKRSHYINKQLASCNQGLSTHYIYIEKKIVHLGYAYPDDLVLVPG